MIPNSSVIACCVTLFVSLVLPVLLLIVFAARHRKQGVVSAWLLGAAGFVVTQMLIRLPVLTWLQSRSWFAAFAQDHLFGYAFSLAVTAGLFELAGRFGVAKFLGKNLTRNRALAAGLGHGGIEAMLLIGMTYVNNLTYIFLINSGSFDALMAQSAAMGVDVSQLELIRQQLLTVTPVMFLLAGFERILAMIGHLAMSVLVCWGVARKKVLPSLLLCLGIHTLIDLTAGLSQLMGTVLSQTVVYTLVYLLLTAAAVLSVLLLRVVLRRWPEAQKGGEPNAEIA